MICFENSKKYLLRKKNRKTLSLTILVAVILYESSPSLIENEFFQSNFDFC